MSAHLSFSPELKPDFSESLKRWKAIRAGEIIDRPPVWISLPKDRSQIKPVTYYDCLNGDMDALIDQAIRNAENTHWLGDAVPSWRPDYGPDSVAAYTGLAKMRFSASSPDTTWAEPSVKNWVDVLPIKLQNQNKLWKRMLEFYRRAAGKMQNRIVLSPPDTHTNMDLLSAIRGPEQLCMDLFDCPELIQKAMSDTRLFFKDLWSQITAAGNMDATGYADWFYSLDSAAIVQCDFSCMISNEMFNQFVLPVLEEEIACVKTAVYHWDGPGALKHAQTLYGIKDLFALSYVIGAGNSHDITLYQQIQAHGKVAHINASAKEIMWMHKQLRPDRVIWNASVCDVEEANRLLEWLKDNT